MVPLNLIQLIQFILMGTSVKGGLQQDYNGDIRKNVVLFVKYMGTSRNE